MKIYQLHEYGGEWEDYFDNIIGSYIHKERAEGEKRRAEAKEKEKFEFSNRCQNCPFLGESYKDLATLIKLHYDYCDKAKLEDDGEEWGITCDNYYIQWDKSKFRIEEVEVIE